MTKIRNAKPVLVIEFWSAEGGEIYLLFGACDLGFEL